MLWRLGGLEDEIRTMLQQLGADPTPALISELAETETAGWVSAVTLYEETVPTLTALRERGLSVPQDVAVVGYDDVTLAAHTAPALTTIRQDLVVGAKALIEILFRRIAGEPAQSLQLDPQLIVRGSSVA